MVAFIWSVKSGQYDDTYTPSVRILFDDAVKKEEKSEVRSQETEGGKSRKTEVRSRKTRKRSVEK